MSELSAAGYVVIPRTNVALKPPGGFQVAEDFPALVSDYSEITVIQERPAQPDPKKALEELEATFISGTAGGEETELRPYERVKIDGRTGFAAYGVQPSEEGYRSFGKAVVGFHEGEFDVTVIATVSAKEKLTEEQLLRTLKGLRWSEERAPGELSFSGTPANGFEQLPSSYRLIYALGGKSGLDVPTFRVTREFLPEPVPKREQREFAEYLAPVRYGGPIKVDGLRGWEFDDGQSAGNDTYGAVLFTGDEYILALGSTRPDTARKYVAAFRKMTRSLEVRR
jgi:hypothetical protein